MASVTIDIDLPEGITILSYARCGEAHGFEVDWDWPERCHCPRCGHDDKARWELTGKARVVRDLDVWGQPSFWSYPAAFHRCERCHHRQDLLPPFKRKDTSYTLRFEQHVVRLLIGSTESDVARRLGISAVTVARIVQVRVITKRAYGLKSANSLWTRLILDLNRAQEIVIPTIAGLRDVVNGFRAVFSMVCS